jgi:hypothetical protein
VPGLATVVGLLVAVELASGVLQGYYTPIYSDIGDALRIADGDLNWFEAAQLITSALLVPLLARLGDVVGPSQRAAAVDRRHGARLLGDGLRAGLHDLPGRVGAAGRVRRLAAARGGDHLPPTAGSGQQDRLTRRAAAVLVAGLEAGVIVGALTSGALVERTSMTVLLSLPAVVVTACLLVVWFGIEPDTGEASGGVDLRGLGLVTVVLGLVMAGLVVVRLQGAGSALAWGLVLLGLAAVVPLVRVERELAEPLVDVRLLASAGQWPIQLTAFLFGMSVLGAQIPLSTFARTDPDVAGYGLGADASFVSALLGLYVVCILLGALLLPAAARLLGPRGALVAGCGLVSLGYALWLPFHDTAAQGVTNLAVVGVGSGILVAALPAAAAAAAPATAPASRPG